MKLAEIKATLQAQLNSRFAALDFNLRKADFEYVRQQHELRNIFRITVHAKTGWFLVTPEVFVGSKVVNELFNKILSRNLPSNGSTVGFSIDNESQRQRGHYQVEHIDDIPLLSESIWRDFDEIALPFFNTITSIKSLSDYVNTVHDGQSPAGSISNACIGLILAKLAGDVRLKELGIQYFNFWSQAQSPKLANDILIVQNAVKELTSANGT